jgi:hypothetical protein
MQFWREMVKALAHMKYSRSKADPCLISSGSVVNFKFGLHGLMIA